MSEKCKMTTSLNLRRNALTQYQDYNFNSACVVHGIPMACSIGGIFELDSGSDFAGLPIRWLFELVKTNFGYSGPKRLRKIYLGVMGSSLVNVECSPDKGEEVTYTITPMLSNRQCMTRIATHRSQLGNYWAFRVHGEGADFSVDEIDVLIVRVGHGR